MISLGEDFVEIVMRLSWLGLISVRRLRGYRDAPLVVRLDLRVTNDLLRRRLRGDRDAPVVARPDLRAKTSWRS